MNFSAILDISSFFIGMIINLLLIALICYYFKRKYENLEIAQNEQAKVLYQLLQQNSKPKVMNLQDILGNVPLDVDIKSRTNSFLDSNSNSDSGSDSDSSSGSDSGLESENELNSVSDSKMKKTIEIENLNLNLNSNSPIEVSSFTVKKIVDIDNSLDMDTNIKLDTLDTLDMDTIILDKLDKLDTLDTLDTLDKLKDDDSKESYSKMTIKQLKDILSVKGINSGKMKKNEIIELIEKSSINIDEQSK